MVLLKYLVVVLVVLISLQFLLTKVRYLHPAWQRVVKEEACKEIISQVKASILWEGPNSSCFVSFSCPLDGPACCLRLPLPGDDLTLGVKCP